MRDKSIDVGRGLLVLLMVYCHVLQFFGDTQLFPLAGHIIDGVNMTVFPTFVFYFGMTAVLAYLSKPYLRALPGMMKTSLRAYGAFVVSGVGYRVLREGKAFAPGTVRRVMQLADIPGWSEFLIAFALYGLLLIVLFPLLRLLARRPVASLMVSAACIAATFFIPYSRVAPTQLALFIGGRDFSYFPVLHYAPYLLAGMVFAQGDKRTRRRLLLLAVLCSAAGAVYWVMDGMPSRFPPSWAWILVCALCTAVVVLAGGGLSALAGGGIRRVFDALCDVLSHLGSRSLYYLLASNLVIFTLAGRGITPALARKSIPPWTLPIQSPQGAACWTAVLLLAVWFAARLAGRGAGKKG